MRLLRNQELIKRKYSLLDVTVRQLDIGQISNTRSLFKLVMPTEYLNSLVSQLLATSADVILLQVVRAPH